MSLTETARHWLWGWALATAASRSDVNVAMPHLRGRWSPTKAILRTFDVACMKAIPLLPGGLSPPRLFRFSGLRRGGEMQRVPQVLQFPVIVNRGRTLSAQLQSLQKCDFLFGGV